MIKIEKLNNGFKVEGIDNVLYPDNGTLVFGPKTVIPVTDESDMVTFRSASNFDVLFSGLINNITIDGESVTKDNIVEKFQAIANDDVSEQLSNYETIANHNADKALLEASNSLKANSADLATVATSGSYNDLSNKPTIPTVPTNVSEFTNDAGYITQNDIANKQDKLTAGENITIENNVISSTGGTQIQSDWNQTDVEAVDYIKNKPTFPDMTNYYTKEEIDNKFSEIETLLSQI